MSLFSRIRRGIQVGLDASRTTAPDMKLLSSQIDAAIESGTLPVIEEKEATSKLDIRHTDKDLALGMAYGALRMFFRHNIKNIPPYGMPERDVYMSDFWRYEPILAGAVYSMSAKMSALSWIVSGPRLRAMKAAQLFARASHMGGQDWGGFLSCTAQDFYTTNNGVFWETARGTVGNTGVINALAGPLGKSVV